MTNELKILIVEDDVLISEHLKMILENFNQRVLGVCASLNEFNEIVNQVLPDFVFLDIRMNGVDEGIEIAKILNLNNIPFCFLTSFSDKKTLMDAVIQKPAGYIVKPFSIDDIKKIVDAAINLIQDQFLEIGNSNKINRIKFKDILWLKSDNVYVEIVCSNDKFVTRAKLNDLHDKLPKNIFVRTNQSYIINVNEVKTITNNSIFINDYELPVSKKYKNELKEFFDFTK